MARLISRRELLGNLLGASAATLVGTDRSASANQSLLIAGQAVELSIIQVTPHTVRFSFVPLEGNQPKPNPGSGSIVATVSNAPAARLTTLSATKTFDLHGLKINLRREPMTVEIETKNSRVVQTFLIEEKTGSVSFGLGDGPVLGMGQGGPQFDRRGNIDQMRNGQGGYRLRTHGGRAAIPWLIGTSGWAIFFHQPFGTFDLRGSEGRFNPVGPATALPLDIFVVAVTEPTAVLREYARLTGFPEMPPRWSLGYLQSHRTLAGPQEIMSVARTFREKRLPCDGLIYLGTDFCPSGWNTHNGEFIWHPTNFPDPKEIVKELHARNFKVVLHTVLEGRKLTGAVSDPCTASPLPSGRTPDNRWPEERQVSCYWPVHKSIYDVGIDGWWPDQGDGLDGPSRLARHRMYWEGSQLYRANERPFALHRNGQAGMQRYAAFLWSGDVYSTWETLKTHVSVGINAGLTGIPFWGTDIGGFVPTKEYTGELHVRWFQFGAFCPLFRAHGRTWHLRLPWGWNTGELGPNEIANYTGGAANPDENELHNPNVEPICRKYLELRYRLMTYLYSAVRESCNTGLPIIRALWLHYPDDAAAVARGDEYLWGRDILVAPVTEKGATSRSLYLPRGLWYDFWTGEKVDGGREINRPVDLATIPLYVRAGSILPLDPPRQYTGETVDGPLSLQVFPGADGRFMLYEDDGSTFDYRKGEWLGLSVEWQDKARRLTLRLAEGARMLPPRPRQLAVQVGSGGVWRKVNFAGRQIVVRF
jgi:alpha-glucosidase (family GH31 glycosyl hydrolase)